MAQFTMCPECEQEYHDPANRRYHAQPNACLRCGPKVSLWTAKGKPVTARDIFGHVHKLLKEGKVIAIKGLGGYHLACNALDSQAVKTLRQRKYREDKPFAIMMRDLEVVKRICVVSAEEAVLLQSYRSPIVLLRKRRSPQVASLVAPENPYLGVMLPYTPLHVLLFDNDLEALVMTSGNYSQEPIVFHDKDARQVLAPIADYLLTHNRPIQRRCDDSVVRVLDGKESLLRRARGYAPTPIRLFRTVGDILACGAELKNTFCFGKGYYAYVSHHLGDLENYETLEAFEQGIEDFKQLFALSPRFIAHDLHPDYLSTKYALAQTELQPIAVQHHHAHIASCMAEHSLDEPVIGIALDGLGLGSDGTLWGGEVLICTYSSFQRIAHLRPMMLPGGVQAIKEPWRMGAVYLEDALGSDFTERALPFCQRLKQRGWEQLARIAKQGEYSPLISSLGRLFDAVSAILGVRETIHYEGQAAIELEYLAMRSRTSAHYPFAIDENKKPAIIGVRELFRALALDIERGVARAVVARKFHNSMARLIRETAVLGRRSHGLNKVVLSGGCFQNVLLLCSAVALLLRDGFTVFTHHRLPPNDGCISVGQLMVATATLDAGKGDTDLQ
jgi:hydrogenase maturation protein HypF